jgi:aryl-alcohol dehydrogenase-like predicted oxidoreductase
MDQRPLGRTGLTVSMLGFGCGEVGGLMTRGTAAERDRAVRTAVDHGVTYFDTAADYGGGVSEENLGRALRGRSADPVVGTKVGITGLGTADVAASIMTSADRSLARLGRDRLDLLQLHYWVSAGENRGRLPAAERMLTAERILSDAVPALQRLRELGKVRAFGFSGIGDRGGVLRLIDADRFGTVQLPFNALNPSGMVRLPPESGVPDLGQAIVRAAGRGTGVLAVRVLAGGALSGSLARPAGSAESVHPIASASYESDVAAARRLIPLVQEGRARDLIDLAVRFAITPREVASAVLGISEIGELESAVASVGRGALSGETYELVTATTVGSVR